MNKNILFLDFDGVVNIPWWKKEESGVWHASYNYPEHFSVNQTQAVQWVSEFCEKFCYDVVITSTWRKRTEVRILEVFLRKAGLRSSVNVVDKTPVHDNREDSQRGDEITHWLKDHPDVKNYIIFDDDDDMTVHMDRLVKTRGDVGFMMNDFYEAKRIHEAFNV